MIHCCSTDLDVLSVLSVADLDVLSVADLDVLSVDIGDIVTASRAFHHRLSGEIEQGLVMASKRRPQDVNL